MRIFLFVFIIGYIATGCSSINQSRKRAGIDRQQLFKNGSNIESTIFWSHYDATQRGGLYMVTPNNKVIVISEPPPDAATNSMLDIVAKTKVKDQVDAEAKISAVKSIAELGKRTVAVNIVRDIAFRIETLHNNNDSIDARTAGLYTQLLETAKEISFAESRSDVLKSKVDILKEYVTVLSKADPASPKPTLADLIEKITKLLE